MKLNSVLMEADQDLVFELASMSSHSIISCKGSACGTLIFLSLDPS